MRDFERNRIDNWARVAANLGLLLTSRRLRNNVMKQVRSRLDHLTEAVSDRYDDTLDRFQSAADALHGRSHWPSRATALALGIGVGAGLGLLLAPSSGSTTRRAIREKTSDLTNRAFDAVSSASERIRRTGTSPATRGIET